MARKIGLLWIEEGLEPLTSRKPDREGYASLCDAVRDALAGEAEMKAAHKTPWIRAGSGVGAAVFNVQAIKLLRYMYLEGVHGKCPDLI